MPGKDDHFLPSRAGQFFQALAQVEFFRGKEFQVKAANRSKSLRLAEDK